MMSFRVLHVEDEPDIREVVEVALSLDPDFETRSCCSGQEALTLAVDWAPDIILLDVMMPVMDGPATLLHLRENAKTAGIPVVFVTARAQSRELDLFRALGAIGVIPKPFDPMTLAASVRCYVPQVRKELKALQDVFLRRVSEDAAMLEWHRFALYDVKVSSDVLTEIRNIAHGLAGAGGIYGFAEISDVAAKLEDAAAIALAAPGYVEAVEYALDLLLDILLASVATNERPQNGVALVYNAQG
jgi:CheY-like chemotaxis protein